MTHLTRRTLIATGLAAALPWLAFASDLLYLAVFPPASRRPDGETN